MRDVSKIKFVGNEKARLKNDRKTPLEFIDRKTAVTVRNFHQSFPQYAVTPLHHLKELSKKLGVGAIAVKDESHRFGLNSFKVLGGAYAVGKYLANQLDMDMADLSFALLKSKAVKEKLGRITFVTATDGNHGRGIAWVARQLGHKAVVFMPQGSSAIRLNNIRNEGAEASITGVNYDDSVKLAGEYAGEHDGVLVQDSAWEGYAEIPAWIMQGYATIIDEALEQLRAAEKYPFTHLFLQAGVGSFAASVLGYLEAVPEEDRPVTAIVEPNEAACFYKSAEANDGKPHAVTGSLQTIMAGLACGEPSRAAWGVLRDYADMFISCPDYVAARGMRMLGNPLAGDPRIISGESGAVGPGLLSLILEDERLTEIAGQLKIGADSKILMINTEGDTDPESYREIVWDGSFPSL